MMQPSDAEAITPSRRQEVRSIGQRGDAGPLLGFPPRSHHVLLPERPTRAALAGLTLYDATLRHQRVAAAAGHLLLRAGLGPLLRDRDLPADLDLGWWRQWCSTIAADHVGPVHRLAFRFWEDRVAGLLLNADAVPVGFAKLWRDPPGPPREDPDLQGPILTTLAAHRPRSFRTPALLCEGSHEGWHYLLFEALPGGRHRPLPPDPHRVSAIVDEIQTRLTDVPRPATTPAHHVVSHGDLTPRNLRLAGDGQAWLIDWEYARWAPRLADELRFWVTSSALRARPRPERDGRGIVALLRRRGSESDIAEALHWRDYITPSEASIRHVIAREAGVRLA